MTNPFYVDPTGGIDTGSRLAGLGQSLAGLGALLDKKKDSDAASKRKSEAMTAVNAAFQSGNPDEISNVIIQYPEMAESLSKAMSFKSDATKSNFIESAKSIVTNPNNTEQILTTRIENIIKEGGDPTDSILALKEYKDNPEEFIQKSKNVFAAYDPQGWKSYSSAQQSSTNEYTYVAYDKSGMPYGINKKTGEYEPIAGGFVRADQKPQTVVNVGGNQSEFQKETGKLNAKAFAEIASQGKQIRSEENKINRLIQLNEKAYEGAGSDTKLLIGQVAKNFGIDIEGLPESEAFRAISNELVLDKSQQMSGALSEGDMAFLRKTVPNLGNTKEGRKQVFDYSKKLMDRQKEYIKKANEFRKDNGYFDQSEFDVQFQDYVDQNPLFEQVSDDDLISKYL